MKTTLTQFILALLVICPTGGAVTFPFINVGKILNFNATHPAVSEITNAARIDYNVTVVHHGYTNLGGAGGSGEAAFKQTLYARVDFGIMGLVRTNVKTTVISLGPPFQWMDTIVIEAGAAGIITSEADAAIVQDCHDGTGIFPVLVYPWLDIRTNNALAGLNQTDVYVDVAISAPE